MKDRIRKIRKDIDLNQTEFGAAIGCSQTSVAKYETGRVIPDKPIVLLLCEKFHVNQTWLETGEGEPYKASGDYAILRALDAMPDLKEAFATVLPRITLEDMRTINEMVRKYRQSRLEE